MTAGWTVRNISTSPEAHPTNYSTGTGVISLKIKRPGCEVDCLPLLHLVPSIRIYEPVGSLPLYSKFSSILYSINPKNYTVNIN